MSNTLPGSGASSVDVCIFAPTPLLTVTIEREGTEPRIHVHVGGQGTWIARMVTTLGATARFCGPFGGETGKVAHVLCERQGFEVHAVGTSGWNGAYAHDRRSGERIELAAAPPAALTRHELDDFYSTTVAVALESGACIVSGCHDFDVVPDDVFGRLAADVRAAGVPVIADLSGTALRSLVSVGGPTLIKVSDEELESGGWATRRGMDDVLAGIAKLRAAGAQDVVVSRGSESTLASLGDECYEVRSREVEVVDARGGGDAMSAALGVAFAGNLDPVDSLRLASAAATATMSRHGLASGTRALIEASLPLIDVGRIT